MIPLICKSTLHMPACEAAPLRDDARDVRLLVDHERLASALHQVQSRRLGTSSCPKRGENGWRLLPLHPLELPLLLEMELELASAQLPAQQQLLEPPLLLEMELELASAQLPEQQPLRMLCVFSRFKPQRPVEGHIALRGYAAWTAEGGPPRRGEAAVIPRAEASTR